MPAAGKPIARGGRTILFPASALGRKGAYELRAALSGVDAELVVAGGATEHDGAFWDGLKVRRLDGRMPERLAVVVLPAVIEHQPRALLRALAAGIPVIATPACGLGEHAGAVYRPGARPRGLARGAGTGARRQHLGLVIIPRSVTSQGGGGLYLHAVLAVDEGDGAILGLMHACFLARDAGRRSARGSRPLAEKESRAGSTAPGGRRRSGPRRRGSR